MAILKEDGRLDVEWIRNLPIEEKIIAIGNLTQKQYKEYWANIPPNENQGEPIKIAGVYNMQERGVGALEFLKLMRQKYEHNR